MMKKGIMSNALVGMGIGFPVMVGCMILFGGFNAVTKELLVWLVASALYGILSGVMFSWHEELPLPAALGLHCLGCLTITVTAAVLCGYITGLSSAVAVLIPFVVIYGAIYGGCVWAMKRNEKQINQALDDQ